MTAFILKSLDRISGNNLKILKQSESMICFLKDSISLNILTKINCDCGNSENLDQTAPVLLLIWFSSLQFNQNFLIKNFSHSIISSFKLEEYSNSGDESLYFGHFKAYISVYSIKELVSYQLRNIIIAENISFILHHQTCYIIIMFCWFKSGLIPSS